MFADNNHVIQMTASQAASIPPRARFPPEARRSLFICVYIYIYIYIYVFAFISEQLYCVYYCHVYLSFPGARRFDRSYTSSGFGRRVCFCCFLCFCCLFRGGTQTDDTRGSVTERKIQNQSFAPAFGRRGFFQGSGSGEQSDRAGRPLIHQERLFGARAKVVLVKVAS